jgi:hypothetical protein
MARKMKSALTESLQAEDTAFRNRFERAESLLGGNASKDTDPVSSEKLESIAETSASQVVRDTFTFPVEDLNRIAEIQERCLQSAKMVNRSEIVRAGLQALSRMTDAELVEVVNGLTKVRPGRPSSKNK